MSVLLQPGLVRRLSHSVITKPWSIAAGPLTLGLVLDRFNAGQGHACDEGVDIYSKVRVRELGAAHQFTYSIVTPDKNDPSEGRLSCCSPLGFALLGKHKGEQVTVRALFHDLRFVVDKVSCCDNKQGGVHA